VRLGVLSAVVAILIAIAAACEIGGDEGDKCNPLVLQDECKSGLHCKAATCSESYCCPTDRASTDPHCSAEGCPNTDAAAAVDAGTTGSAADGGDGGDAG
jgi:hypothetical protein